MEWFEGGIGEAVAKARTTNACLLVFVEGTDTSSKLMEDFFTKPIIYEALNVPQFVCIRFTQDTTTYVHFASIYKFVPVPSIFFIGQGGRPIEVATVLTDSVDELQQKIAKVQKILATNNVATTTANVTTTAENVASVVNNCPGGVCTLPQQRSAQPQRLPTQSQTVAKDDNLTERQQREQHLKNLQEKLRHDKMTEQAARERVRAQIAADRREQAQNHAQVNSKTEQQQQEQQPSVNVGNNKNIVNNNQAQKVRLQFRLANGETSVQIFESQHKLLVVRSYVREELLGQECNRNFVLATSYPKRELTVGCDEMTLAELGLCPSAVILVLIIEPLKRTSALSQRFGHVFTIMSNIFWALVSPIVGFTNYLSNAIFQRAPINMNDYAESKKDDDSRQSGLDAAIRRNNAAAAAAGRDANDAVARRWAGGSNVHRLRDQRKNDDDDNATWNGNSTQQQ